MNKLPVVTPVVSGNVATEIFRGGGKEHTKQILKLISEDNPEIGATLKYYLEEEQSPDACACGIVIYKMLEAQLEIDNLDKLAESNDLDGG